jgi:hypothetical protein
VRAVNSQIFAANLEEKRTELSRQEFRPLSVAYYFGMEGTDADDFALRGPSNQLYRSVLSRTKWIMIANPKRKAPSPMMT